MKGRFKDRAKQISLIVLFLIISTLAITLIAGRINTQQILIVKKEGLQTNVPLDQQLEFFETKEILKSEMKYFKGTVVTNPKQLEGKVTQYEFKIGSPIPFSSLMEPQGAGQFAAVMPKGRTVHLLSQAKVGLPPVEQGDKINIALVYKEKLEDNTEALRVGMLMTDVEVYRTGETDIYVDVSLEESLVLHTASQLGTFIYQIPGQKLELTEEGLETELNEDEIPSVIEQSDIFEAILNKTYSSIEDNSKENLDIDITESADSISKSIVSPSDDKEEEKDSEDNNNKENNSDENSGGENNEQQD